MKKYAVKTNKKIDLSLFGTGPPGKIDKDTLKKKTKSNIKKIKRLQEKLYAQSKKSLLIIMQALDAGGKDGVIRKVFGKINPQGCRVSSFKAPTEYEMKHDYLWRIHKEVPEKGMIGIFNRSHYEEVLIVRVHEWIDEKECEDRYRHINEFEKHLSDNGVRILKFYLHISKDEQKRRFAERLAVKEKNWKFSVKDLEERKLWGKYMGQFEEVFQKTGKKYAPWYIIPADNNSYRDYLISTIVLKTMENMDLAFPKIDFDPSKIVIE